MVRVTAMSILGRLHSHKVVPIELLAAGLKSEDRHVRINAALALAFAGDWRGKFALVTPPRDRLGEWKVSKDLDLNDFLVHEKLLKQYDSWEVSEDLRNDRKMLNWVNYVTGLSRYAEYCDFQISDPVIRIARHLYPKEWRMSGAGFNFIEKYTLIRIRAFPTETAAPLLGAYGQHAAYGQHVFYS